MNKAKIQKLSVIVGCVLLVLAILTLALWRWNSSRSERFLKESVEKLTELMPPPRSAVPEEKRDNTMPVLSLDGENFVGIIELPRYASSLPICNEWGSVSKYPCRFDGSIYDGTLMIGATSGKGQYDFSHELSLGDEVLFTDMEGNRYSFKITALRQEKHADRETLEKVGAALVLFIKNVYSFDYLVVYCN